MVGTSNKSVPEMTIDRLDMPEISLVSGSSGQPLQFAAPDTAHATGVTIAFIAGGHESTTRMNQSLLDSG